AIVKSYRDLDAVFDLDLLPRVPIRIRRRCQAVEFSEVFSQEWEEPDPDCEEVARTFHAELESSADAQQPWAAGYASYQPIRNVLAAHATGTSFCVLLDQRRLDLIEAWFEIMRAVRMADLRTRLKVLTWQELVPQMREDLRRFLDLKYGIVGPGCVPSSLEDE